MSDKSYWSIPLIWQCFGIAQVDKKEALTLREAVNKVFNTPTPLPPGAYIEDSLQVDYKGITIHNPEITEQFLDITHLPGYCDFIEIHVCGECADTFCISEDIRSPEHRTKKCSFKGCKNVAVFEVSLDLP